MDHFIPVSSGYGGTYKGNVIPLTSTLNGSKHNRNPLEWFEKYGEMHNIDSDRWQYLIQYLATENHMSVSDYTKYVERCFGGD